MAKNTYTILIKNKVISRENIASLYNSLYHEFTKFTAGKELSVRLSYAGNEHCQFENEKPKYFLTKIDERTIESINLELRQYSTTTDKNIEISLRSGNNPLANSIRISSSNQGWGSKEKDEIKILFDSMQEQSTFWIRVIRYLVHGIRIVFGYTLLILLTLLIEKSGYIAPESGEKGFWTFLLAKIFGTKTGGIIGVVIFSYLFGFIPSVLLEEKLLKLIKETWPNIEFDFGPISNRKAKKNRQILTIVSASFIFPFLLQILFRYLSI